MVLDSRLNELEDQVLARMEKKKVTTTTQADAMAALENIERLLANYPDAGHCFIGAQWTQTLRTFIEGKAEMDGGHCYECQRKYGDEYGFPDLVIPDKDWEKISPKNSSGGLLCPSCICKRLYDLGIETEGQFMSGPLNQSDKIIIDRADVPEGLAEALEYYTPEKIATKHSKGRAVLKAAALIAKEKGEQ